jgi:hypothetical protein
LGVLEFLGLSGFVCTILCTPLLLVNFSWIISASGCRHVVLNHLNLGILCGYACLFSILHFFTSLVILDFVCHNNLILLIIVDV